MAEGAETAALLDELLKDAQLVAAYGQRTGRLRSNDLIIAIASVEGLTDRKWSSPEVVALQLATNAALQGIAPTTLADLRSDWKPFEHTSSRKQLAFVLATLILMVVTALATFEYNRGVNLLRGVELLQRDDPRAEIGAIVRQLLAVGADAGNPVAEVPLEEPHFALIDRLHEIDGRLAFYLPEMSQFRASHQLPHELLGGATISVQRAVSTLFSPSAAVAGSTDDSTKPGAGQKACEGREEARATYVSTFVTDTPLAQHLGNYLQRVLDVVCAEGIIHPPTSIPSYARFIADMGDWSGIWGLWYLPALYGALGAMLYYMRRILDPTIPDPPAIRITHRTALGAFAGVIVTWFWAPNAELSEGFNSIGLTVFTVAFLVGFGIEVLFALLDRMVSTLIDFAKGNSPPPAPPPAPSAG